MVWRDNRQERQWSGQIMLRRDNRQERQSSGQTTIRRDNGQERQLSRQTMVKTDNRQDRQRQTEVKRDNVRTDNGQERQPSRETMVRRDNCHKMVRRDNGQERQPSMVRTDNHRRKWSHITIKRQTMVNRQERQWSGQTTTTVRTDNSSGQTMFRTDEMVKRDNGQERQCHVK